METLFFSPGDIISYDLGTRTYFGIVGEGELLVTAAYIEPGEILPRLHFSVRAIRHTTRNGRIVCLADKYERAMCIRDIMRVMREGSLSEEEYEKCESAIIYAVQYDKTASDYDSPNPLVRIDIQVFTDEKDD